MERSIILSFKFPVVNVYTYFSGQAAPGVIWGLIKVKEKKVSAGLPIILMGLSVPLDPLSTPPGTKSSQEVVFPVVLWVSEPYQLGLTLAS